MVTAHRELETKFDVDDAVELPPLAGLLAELSPGDPTALTVGEAGTLRLRATYLDTADLRLAAAGLTLRRRTGGTDAGWHLKVPDGDGARTEVRLPAGRSARAVPARLRSMVHARTGGAPLVPVAQIETVRTVRHVVDATGRVLLELADDRVTARRVRQVEGSGDALGAPTRWREVEVEVVDGDAELLAALGRALVAAGLRPAEVASKVGRVVGGGRGSTARARSRGPRLKKGSPASDVVLAYLAAQDEQLRAQDLRVRLAGDGAVHAMRVATRRMRSALATFGSLLRPGSTTALVEELRWLAHVLGEARDAEVVRGRVAASVAGERPDDLPAPTVADDLDAQLGAAWERGLDTVLAELDGERYRALLAALEAFLGDPPLRPRAARPAADVLPKLVRRSLEDVAKAMRRADRTEGGARTELLHEARKAAKRTRYAAEALEPAVGKPARALAAAMEQFQEELGHHLDTLVTQDRLRSLADGTGDPRTAFTLGRLHALAGVRAERSEADVDAAWAVARKASRRWLD